MKRVLLLVFLSAGLAACGSNETAGSLDGAANAGPAASDLPDAPEFELASFGGGAIRSEDLRGKVVVLDFWATWCAPCIEEIPDLNALHSEYVGDDVVILGVTVESGSYEDVEPYIERFDIEYPVVMGTEDVVRGFGGIIGFPTKFVVSPDWKVYKKHMGGARKGAINQDIIDLLGARQAPEPL